MPTSKSRLWVLGIAVILILGGISAYFFLYEGAVSIYVKDATGTWSHVNVTFSAVDIHESGKDNASWQNVVRGTHKVDLAVLTNLSTLLGSQRLAPGHYEQIRITVVNVTAVDTTGATYYIPVVNGTLKIVQQFSISSGQTTVITLDVDLTRSIIGTPLTGYTFTPVIGATVS